MIIGLDFDGTCCTHEYPKIGKDIDAFGTLRDLLEEGHQLILNTMRSGKELEEAVEWLKDNGVTLYGVNTNPTQHTWTKSPKVYAHIYIDDAALGCPIRTGWDSSRPYVDWKNVRAYLIENGILTSKSLGITEGWK